MQCSIVFGNPKLIILDNGGYALLFRELEGKEILLDDSKPIIYKGIPNPTVANIVQAALKINPDILIVSDWPVRTLKGKAEQNKEFEKKLHYNIDAANKTIKLLSGYTHNMKLYVAVQAYSLCHLRRFLGAICLKKFDGVSMPIRGQSIEQTALFLLKFWQMGFRNVHLLGVAALFPMALAAYFECVKVLNHRTNAEVKKIVRESSRRQMEESDPDDPEIVKLTDELGDILKPYVSEDDEEEPVKVNNHPFQMVDLFPGDPCF